MSDTLKKKNQNLMEQSHFSTEGSHLKKRAKSIRRINRHLQREQSRKEAKVNQPKFLVTVNDHEFRVTQVTTKEEALKKLEKWSAYRTYLRSLEEKGEEITIKVDEIE